MKIIALTGGIGSGKSTIASLFSQYCIPIIDTDIIARDLVKKNQPSLTEIARYFGNEMLTEEGELNRIKLRQLVFSDSSKRLQLEAILHPRILEAVKKLILTFTAPYCLLVIPLFVETRQKYPHDRTLVVDSTRELQLQRLHDRDQIADTLAHQILDAQATREERLAIADDIITNTGSITDLAAQVATLHAKYLKLANSPLP